MYKLIQIKKSLYKTFEEICPKHSITLGRWDKLTDKEKSKEHSLLCSSARCFVGEAHGGLRSCGTPPSGYGAAGGIGPALTR